MRLRTTLALALLALTLTSSAYAVRRHGGVAAPIVTGLLMPAPNNIAANWANAGLLAVGGIPNRTTQCGATVMPSGIVPPAAGDDASLINAAAAACTPGDFVQLGAGANITITASISGNTLTVTSGSGLAVGDVLTDYTTKIYAGTTITGGSGSSWTVSITQTVASETMHAIVPFNVSKSEMIQIHNSITLRGSGSSVSSCTNVCWPTIINVYDGAVPDWTVGTRSGGNPQCGVSSTSTSTCGGSSLIVMSPSNNNDWGWAGCFFLSTPTSCGATLTADAAQGDTTVHVSSTANFAVGMWALIDENPQTVTTTNPTGGTSLIASPEFLTASPSPAVMRLQAEGPSSNYSLNPNRLNAELHKITAIGSGTLTFDDPVTLAFRQSGSHDARVYWPTFQSATANPFLDEPGIENLTITRAFNGAILSVFTSHSWVKGVECAGWVGGCVNLTYAARAQIDSNYIHDCYDCENSGIEYPVGLSSATTEAYVVNNIIVRGGKGMVARGACCSNISYNYVDDSFYMASSIGDSWVDMGLNASHYGGSHSFAFEGNWANNCDNDETHGNSIYHVFFRNECTGIRTTFVDPSNGKTVNDTANSCWGQNAVASGCGPLRAAGPMAYAYWTAYIGNVLGLAGVTTTANGWAYQGAFCGGASCPGGVQTNKDIWMSGWVGGEQPSTDPNLTTTTNPFIFRHGNYDYVTGSIADWTTGYTHTLPNSIYLSSAPAFFSAGTCTYPWPWVTPTSGSPIQTNSCSGSGLPAKARFDAGTPFVQP